MGLFFIFAFICIFYLVYMLTLPTTCSGCNKILIKKHIKRIGLSPYCQKCYNKIEEKNKEE